MNKKNKIFLRPLIATLGILAIPLFGTIFIEGWDWGPIDFIVMGVLIFITGLLIEQANKRIKETNYKIIAILGILGVLALIWIELATDGVSRWLGLMFG